MLLKRIGLVVLAIVTFTSIINLIRNFAEAADKGFDTPMEPSCVTDCATYLNQAITGISACVILAIIWFWIFRRRNRIRSSTTTVPREQESTLKDEPQKKRTTRSRKKPFDDSENDLFGPDDGQGSIFS